MRTDFAVEDQGRVCRCQIAGECQWMRSMWKSYTDIWESLTGFSLKTKLFLNETVIVKSDILWWH
jgi:hypothetical protein